MELTGVEVMLETRGIFMGGGRTLWEVVDMFWLGRGCGSSYQCFLESDSSSSMMVGSLDKLLFNETRLIFQG